MTESLSLTEIRTETRTFDWDGLPLLYLSFALPRLDGPPRTKGRIERYYAHFERSLLRFAQRLSQRYCREAQAALAASRPISIHELTLTCEAEAEDALLHFLFTLTLDDRSRRFVDHWGRFDALPRSSISLPSSQQPLAIHK